MGAFPSQGSVGKMAQPDQKTFLNGLLRVLALCSTFFIGEKNSCTSFIPDESLNYGALRTVRTKTVNLLTHNKKNLEAPIVVLNSRVGLRGHLTVTQSKLENEWDNGGPP